MLATPRARCLDCSSAHALVRPQGHEAKRVTDILKAALLFERNRKRFLALTTIGARQVLTVFLVFHHSFGLGPPKLFESAVYERGAWRPIDRATTYKRALKMHHRIVNALRAGAAPGPNVAAEGKRIRKH